MTVVTALAAASGVGAQQATPLLSVDARLGDFGLDDLDSVLHGRVSLVHDPAGDRIALQLLKGTPPSAVPAGEPIPILPPPASGEVQPGLKALWVWNTQELLQDASERRTFLDFIQSQAIERVFLYLPAAPGEQPSAGYIPFDGEALAPLLAELRKRGALTYALDGDRDYIREENHAGVLRTVQRVAEHKLAMERDLREALERNEFLLRFQPQVDGNANGVARKQTCAGKRHRYGLYG
jgi:hypothetical protein